MRWSIASMLTLAGGLAMACATAIEDHPLDADREGAPSGATQGGSPLARAGASGSAGKTPNVSAGGRAGASAAAFGGTATSDGDAGSAEGGGSSGGDAGGNSGGAGAGSGNGGGSSAGASSDGNASGGTGSGGSAAGSSGSAGGPAATVCDGVPDWSSQAYAIGDTVASTCSGVFAASCPQGQSHQFECDPVGGQVALPWCQQRQPGVGNGWADAWVDKGQCQ